MHLLISIILTVQNLGPLSAGNIQLSYISTNPNEPEATMFDSSIDDWNSTLEII